MKEVTVNEVPKGAQLIDVREPDEFSNVHAVGAVNLPMSEFVSHVDKLDQDKDIYLICRSGGRSGQVAEYLEQRGITAINVAGGTVDWVHQGLATEGDGQP